MKKQIFLYIIGLILFSLGANSFILSQLGTDPLDVLLIGLGLWFPVSIGDASVIISIAFLAVYSIWNKTYPPVSSILTTVATGYLVDLWIWISFPVWEPWGWLTIGVIMCSLASAIIIHSRIGIRIMDLLVLTMQEKLGWKFTSGKLAIEICLFSIGWSLGGPFGIGTIIFLLGVSVLIEPFLKLVRLADSPVSLNR